MLCFSYTHAYEFVHAKSHLSCLTLCDPMDCSHQAPLSTGILQQARILEWVTMPSSRGALPGPRIKPMSFMSPALADRFSTTSNTLIYKFSTIKD